MIDYRSRIEQVCSFLQATVGVADSRAVAILLATALQHPNLPNLWLILETDWYSLFPHNAWFAAFAPPEACQALAELRSHRPTRGNELLKAGMDKNRGQQWLFYDAEYKEPVRVNRRYLYWPYLMQDCLRLRTATPKSRLLLERERLELKQLVRNNTQVFREDPAAKPIALPLYLVELAQKLSGRHRDWATFLDSIAVLTRRLVWLFDGTDVMPYVLRVLRDCVPYWVVTILSLTNASKESRRGTLLTAAPYFRRELKRLKEEGFLQWSSASGWWKLTNLGEDALQFINQGSKE